jgi:hypothetical protein
LGMDRSSHWRVQKWISADPDPDQKVLSAHGVGLSFLR